MLVTSDEFYRLNCKQAYCIAFYFVPNRKFTKTNRSDAAPLLKWCLDNLGEHGALWENRVMFDRLNFFFVEESDAITFRLVFSEYV